MIPLSYRWSLLKGLFSFTEKNWPIRIHLSVWLLLQGSLYNYSYKWDYLYETMGADCTSSKTLYHNWCKNKFSYNKPVLFLSGQNPSGRQYADLYLGFLGTFWSCQLGFLCIVTFFSLVSEPQGYPRLPQTLHPSWQHHYTAVTSS